MRSILSYEENHMKSIHKVGFSSVMLNSFHYRFWWFLLNCSFKTSGRIVDLWFYFSLSLRFFYFISVTFYSGQVELENVPLKKTALRKFDIPLQVGLYFGKGGAGVGLMHLLWSPVFVWSFHKWNCGSLLCSGIRIFKHFYKVCWQQLS